jgi:ureidoglycolate hydrolase
MIRIRTLNQKDFSKYGRVLEQKNKKKVFSVIEGDKNAAGWRIGYLITTPDRVQTFEEHPGSKETFEPVSGTTVILVAGHKTPDKIEAFLLDKPVCLEKNTWHAVSVISERAEIKITENYDVESVFHKLKKPIDISFS